MEHNLCLESSISSSASHTKLDSQRTLDTGTRICEFCHKNFSRSDALRRHYLSCSDRGQRQIPRPLPRGRRKRACDSCARHKVTCDNDLPCENCLLFNYNCTYSRTGSEKQEPKSRYEDGELALHADHRVKKRLYSRMSSKLRKDHAGSKQSNHKISIPFLRNWINPNSHITDTFEHSSEMIDNSGSIDSHDHTLFHSKNEHTNTIDGICPLSLPNILSSDCAFLGTTSLMPESGHIERLLPDLFLPFQNTYQQKQYLAFSKQADISPFVFDFDNLERNLRRELVERLEALSESLVHEHLEQDLNLNLVSGMAILTTPKLHAFIRLYFHNWNRHSPVVHHGTFDVTTAFLPLILAIALAGAFFSYSQDDITIARTMLDIAEELSFQDPIFCKLISGIIPGGTSERRQALEALQAAFTIAQLQLREGSVHKRRYVRTVRFDQIVYAARTISLHNTRNKFYEDQTDPLQLFDWNNFSESESRIRLMGGIFNLDTAFTILYKIPPRLFFHELQVAVPCSLEAYMADSESTSHEAAMKELKPRPYLLTELISAFAHNCTDLYAGPEGLGPLCLFFILFGMLQIIWNSTRHGASRESMQQLRSGFTLWKVRWDITLSGMTPQQVQQCGFIKDAGTEFWYLGYYLLTMRGDPAEQSFEGGFRSRAEIINTFTEVLGMAEELE